MLPFLKKKEQSISSPVVKHRTPDDKSDLSNHDEDKGGDSDAIEACAKYLLYGIETRDVKAVAQAMADAFDILEQRPHKEDEDHEPSYNDEPNSMEAMNKAAASKRTIG